MRSTISWRRIACAAALIAVCAGGGKLLGQGESSPFGPSPTDTPPIRRAPMTAGSSAGGTARSQSVRPSPTAVAFANLPMGEQPQVAEHPLAGALRIAEKSMDNINKNVKDYTCTMIKRERIDGEVTDPEYMYVKVRHQPFSVYLNFLKPADEQGREVIYVEGRNNGKMTAHEGSGLKARFGAVDLNPTSAMAMKGNKYPITQLGVKNLVRRLLEVGTQDMKYGECDVTYRKNAKVNDRVCTIIEVTHPVPRRNFIFHKALIYVDDELNLPIRYEAYTWPKTQGGRPELDEEYTYLNLKVNVGLTDADFEPANPNYHFK
jgi:Protein of unknown function (DUF1571)